MAEIEELELRHDLQRLGLAVELDDEVPRVEEDIGAEVDGAAGERARVRQRVDDREPRLVGVGDRAAGRELDDQIGGLAYGGHGVGEASRIQARPCVRIPDMDVDEGRAGGLAGHRRGDEPVESHRQGGSVGRGGFGPGRSHRDQGRV